MARVDQWRLPRFSRDFHLLAFLEEAVGAEDQGSGGSSPDLDDALEGLLLREDLRRDAEPGLELAVRSSSASAAVPGSRDALTQPQVEPPGPHDRDVTHAIPQEVPRRLRRFLAVEIEVRIGDE